MKKNVKQKSYLPKVMLLLFILMISLFTYTSFFRSSTYSLFDIPFYFLPTLMLLLILKLGWRHIRLLEIAVLTLSFMFLVIYPVYIGIFAFFYLLFLSVLFFIDDYKNNHYQLKKLTHKGGGYYAVS